MCLFLWHRISDQYPVHLLHATYAFWWCVCFWCGWFTPFDSHQNESLFQILLSKCPTVKSYNLLYAICMHRWKRRRRRKRTKCKIFIEWRHLFHSAHYRFSFRVLLHFFVFVSFLFLRNVHKMFIFLLFFTLPFIFPQIELSKKCRLSIDRSIERQRRELPFRKCHLFSALSNRYSYHGPHNQRNQ